MAKLWVEVRKTSSSKRVEISRMMTGLKRLRILIKIRHARLHPPMKDIASIDVGSEEFERFAFNQAFKTFTSISKSLQRVVYKDYSPVQRK